MIEKILYNYLNEYGLSAAVYTEQPKDKPAAFFLIEKSGSSLVDHIDTATIIVQSYGTSLLQAAELNEEIKTAMLEAITLDDISKVELNGDYNFTDPATKDYRYQGVYVITHY